MENRTESEFTAKPVKKYDRRGYYSEIATIVDDLDESYFEYETNKRGASKRRKLAWQIHTTKNAPIIYNLDPPTTQTFLAKAERWMCYEKEKQIVS